MKNLRKVVALVLAFAMVLSMSAVTFAAEMSAAEKAETLGILLGEGDGVTADYLAKAPTRLQAAIISLRLRGLEDEALAFEGTENFADASDIPWAGGQAITAYLYANPELGWIGDGTNFMPNEPITAQQYVKVMLESLGYAQGTEFAWEEVFAYATSVGLDDLSEGTVMTNNQLAVGMVEALSATTSTGETLLDKLIAAGAITEAKAIAAGLVEEEVDFALKSVEAFGLNALKVTFTSDIDDDEAYEVAVEDADGDDVDVDADYTIVDNVMIVVFGSNGIDEDGDYDWDEDTDPTAVRDQYEELEVTVSAFGVDGLEVDEEVVDVVMKDKVDPEVVSVVVENAKTFVVTYSEPVDPNSYEWGTAVFDNVLLDDAKIVGKAEWSDDLTTVTYTLKTAVAANTYVFTTESVEDFAGFVAGAEELTVTVVDDSTEPQIVDVEVNSTKEIVLVFDENVESIGDITVAGQDVDEDNVDVDDEEVTIELTSADGTVLEASDAFISVKVTWEDVEDVIGNSGDGETTFTAPFDDDAPTVEIEISSDNELVLIFSEEVDFESVTPGDIFTVTEDGDEIDATDFFSGTIQSNETAIDDYEDEDEDDLIYYVNLDLTYLNDEYDELDEVEFVITIDGTDDDAQITDMSVLANELQEVEFEVTLEDIVAPAVDGGIYVIDGDYEYSDGDNFSNDDNTATADDDETLRIYFTDEMDEDSLLDEGNYYIGGQPLDEYDYEIEVDDDAMYVDITVEEVDLDGLELELYGVEDVAGNSLTVKGDDAIEIEDAADTFDGVTFELTALDTIEVTYEDGSFTVADDEDFILWVDGDDEALYITSAVVDEDDDSVIILTLSDDVTAYGEYDAVTSDGSLKLEIEVVAGDTVNAFDVPLEQGVEDGTVTDGVEATATIELNDDDEDLLVVSFDELVYFTGGKDIDDVISIYNEDDEEYEDEAETGLVFAYYVGDADDEVADWTSVDAEDGFNIIAVTLEADDEYSIELYSRYLKDAALNVAGGVDEETYLPE